MIHSTIIRADVLVLTGDTFHTHSIFLSVDVERRGEVGLTGGRKLDHLNVVIPWRRSSSKDL
jgi:hypothetical protein